MHSVLRNGELVVITVTKLILFFLICYVGVVISGTAQDVTLCPLIMISINFFFMVQQCYLALATSLFRF